MTGRFIDNAAESRFEYHTQGSMAIADYVKKDGTLTIKKVEAPMELRGTGAASALMRHISDLADKEGLEIYPLCGYAAHWLDKHKGGDAPKASASDAAPRRPRNRNRGPGL